MSVPAERITAAPNLAELLRGIAPAPPLAVQGIASDSRRVADGEVFLACRGARSHGLAHVADALARGAAAVVWEDDGNASFASVGSVASVPVAGLSAMVGTIADRWFGAPSADVDVSGVTGTNGKTTVACLIAQCLQRAGRDCAYIGTLGAGIGEFRGSGLTTPECVEVHRRLAAFRDAGARHAAIEVSSHGLLQHRVDAVRFFAAVFTNLSRDHIDYHGSMSAYGDSKARLFLEHAPRHRIVCIDTAFGAELARRCGNDAIVVASSTAAKRGGHRYLFVTADEATADGALIAVDSSWGRGRCRLPLYGAFNVANAAAVLAVLLCHDLALETALELLAAANAPPGRMQRVGEHDAGLPAVFVDYAHTPAALEAALAALRPHCAGALWCVFGCGGDRDRGKRPMMGAVAERLADRPLLTSDNPRSEDPAAILRDIEAGMRGNYESIVDRAAAIEQAIAAAQDADVVLIAGKGHEDYQLVGDRRIAFSDYQVAAAALCARRSRRARQ